MNLTEGTHILAYAPETFRGHDTFWTFMTPEAGKIPRPIYGYFLEDDDDIFVWTHVSLRTFMPETYTTWSRQDRCPKASLLKPNAREEFFRLGSADAAKTVWTNLKAVAAEQEPDTDMHDYWENDYWRKDYW